MNHRKAGIYKGVSEAVYPADVLAEPTLMGADPAVKGAWAWTLFLMWRDRTHKVTDTMEGWGRVWGCIPSEAERLVTEIGGRNIGKIIIRNGKVTLICRRLERRAKARRDTAKRVAEARARAKGNANVTPPYSLPSSSLSLSLSSSPSVPIGKDMDIDKDKGSVPCPKSPKAPETAKPPVREYQISEKLQQAAFKVFGTIPAINLCEAVELHGNGEATLGERRVLWAIMETEKAGVRNWAYTAKILERCEREGYPPALSLTCPRCKRTTPRLEVPAPELKEAVCDECQSLYHKAHPIVGLPAPKLKAPEEQTDAQRAWAQKQAVMERAKK